MVILTECFQFMSIKQIYSYINVCLALLISMSEDETAFTYWYSNTPCLRDPE